MYLDRIIDNSPSAGELKCEKCGEILGTKVIYQKENRPAYRLYVDAVTKKIVPAKLV
jgi:transcription elongation factor Elf1